MMILLFRKLFQCFFVSCLLSSFGYVQAVENTVQHKNFHLDFYLDTIRYNTHEKIGILPYVLQNPKGTYLEIGTGGDPIAALFEQLPITSSATIIASDVDEKVLQSLVVRHPILKKYVHPLEGPQLVLQQLNAIDMSIFSDDMLDGINASSVVHEIVSYAGGFEGMHAFFKEALRVLRPGGVLVYRDSECVADKQMPVVVHLKNKSIRLFAHIFLYKFLDDLCSYLAESKKGIGLYCPGDVRFLYYRNYESSPINASYHEYLATPFYDIDFSRPITLHMPCGLYREFARHYLTYLHYCNPLVFVQCTPDVQTGLYVVHYFAHSTEALLQQFLQQHNKGIIDGKIDQETKNLIDAEIEHNSHVLAFGVPMRFSSREKQLQIRALIKEKGFDAGKVMVAVHDNQYVMDYRVFGLLYDQLLNIFDAANGLAFKKDGKHAEWLKREGEEFYCYCSPDELIVRVLETSLACSGFYHQEQYVLFPLSSNGSMYIDRLCYTALLTSSLDLYDSFGYPLAVKEGKRVIHFAKMSLAQAQAVAEALVRDHADDYPRLAEWLINNKQCKSSRD